MTPEPQHSPSVVFERPGLFSVPFRVAGQLRIPVANILTWLSAVFWAAVPEASVDEHGDATSREHDVRPYACGWCPYE